MGMDLAGQQGQFRFGNRAWLMLLELANEHGWEPLGTNAPVFFNEDGSVFEAVTGWNGTYFANNFQVVTAEDAVNLADALEQSLELFPDDDELEGITLSVLPDDIIKRDIYIPSETVEGARTSVSLFEVFSGERKQYLRDFIEFCQGGSFHIG